MKIAVFETCLTDDQWALLQPMIPKPEKLGRPRTDPRRIFDALLYVVKGGIQWRLLPPSFPPWKTVYHVFRKWERAHLWRSINDRLRAQVRVAAGKKRHPTAAILDSQSVKSDPHGGEVGFDAGKRIKGRKRHMLVDTMGLLLGIHVTAASVPEREGGQGLLARVLSCLAALRLIWVDGGYVGEKFAQWVKTQSPQCDVTVVKRSDAAQGFEILPRRWVVERTFGWLMRHRRLVRDYERNAASGEAWAYIAMIRIQLRRLA